MTYYIGQRWVSDTESEAGLGIIVEVNNRNIVLFFPAINENRIYTTDNPPLTRIIFDIGDKITSIEGQTLLIETQFMENGIVRYHGQFVDNQEPGSISEIQIDAHLNYSKPQTRLFSGLVDLTSHFEMRYQAQKIRSTQYNLPISGLRGARTTLIPHQLYIAQDIGSRLAPRVILADEVGLGKTIEAGLILHKRLQSGLTTRALIVVPDSLQIQWFVEMLRRFNLRFVLFDKQRLAGEAQDTTNPFESEQLIICTLQVFNDPVRLQQAIEAKFELLIVDEAHHLVWSPEETSPEYAIVEQLTQQIPSILLLTATPEQLGIESHFARLRLLDPARFHDLQQFIDEQKNYQPIADLVNQLQIESTITSGLEDQINQYLPKKQTKSLITQINKQDNSPIKQIIINKIMDLYGPGRILYRNTRQHISGFPKRHLNAIALPALHPLFDQYQWYENDHRAQWLLKFLSIHNQTKVIVICHQKEVALTLADYLKQQAIRCAVFHEDLSIVERDRVAAYFAQQDDELEDDIQGEEKQDAENGEQKEDEEATDEILEGKNKDEDKQEPRQSAQVLICSEIGSEGRNFQFVHHLVLFDLPLNPEVLEQRIGRLDRIGQQHNIEIFVPYIKKSSQARLFEWYNHVFDAFTANNQTAYSLFKKHQKQLINFLTSPDIGDAEFKTFLKLCHTEQQQLKETLEDGRNRLLELHSSGGDTGIKLKQTISKTDNNKSLREFSYKLFDLLGFDQEEITNNSYLLKSTEEARFPNFPGIDEEGKHITYDRQEALSLENTQFITWEHPFITNGIDLIISESIGKTAISTIKNKSLPVGTLLLELIYMLETKAPRALALQRFLPPTPLYLLLDNKGNNLATTVNSELLHKKLGHVERTTAKQIINVMHSQILARLSQADPLVDIQAQQLIEQAIQTADSELQQEISRLTQLKRHNTMIRDEEISLLEKQRQQILHSLAETEWYLDAIHVIVTTHT